MIQTVDNYLSSNYDDTLNYYFKLVGKKNDVKKDKIIIGEKLDISLKDYLAKSSNNTFFSFFNDIDKRNLKNEDDLIISIKKDIDGNYSAQSGNHVGKFVYDGLEIDIKSRFSNSFLERMLNFANDIFLDDVSITGKISKNEIDISKYIIYYMFVQNLEKAFLLGLPKSYKSISHHEMSVKGKIDINAFIKNDIPFKGKVSSVSREQKEIQEVIDVLYKAIKIINKTNKIFLKNIPYIKTHLKQHKSNNYVSNETINKAMKSKALQNPIFAPYKKVLEYARFIINSNSVEEKEKGNNQTYGFIINVAELFEIYITKLLQKEFPSWSITSPKIELYKDKFYARKIIPDIVMLKDNDVIVFDTKYKRMTMEGKNQYGAGDVDRNDFFQINTYMSYYQQNNYNLKLGGLIYPIMQSDKQNTSDDKPKSFDLEKCHAQNWLGNSNTKFIVDGIDLTESETIDLTESKRIENIVKEEKEFIERINMSLI